MSYKSMLCYTSIRIILFMIIALFIAIPTRAAPMAQAQTIQFSGFTWDVRSGGGGPGPNRWDASNVWVDTNGALHLKISYRDGQWSCAEVTSTQRFGFGKYQWQVIGQIDQLDPNVVVGLFNYTVPEIGPDGTNEIDIEFARWGDPANPIGNYTVYPTVLERNNNSYSYPIALNGSYTTHRFTWKAKSILFQSLHGHTNNNRYEFARWKFAPRQPRVDIPQNPLPVHMNLWLGHGQPPTNNQEVEVVISKFTYTPTSTAQTNVDAIVDTDIVDTDDSNE